MSSDTALLVIFGILPAIVGLVSVGISSASSLKRRSLLQMLTTFAVITAVAISLKILKRTFVDNDYPVYTPFVFIGCALAISLIQRLSKD